MFASLMPPIFGGIMPHAGDLNAGPRAVTQNRTDSKDQISNIPKYQASLCFTFLQFQFKIWGTGQNLIKPLQ